MTGFNTSLMDTKDALVINKNDSIHSARKSSRRNVSYFIFYNAKVVCDEDDPLIVIFTGFAEFCFQDC